MPTLLVLATTGVLPADFLLLLFVSFVGVLAFRELFGLRLGVVRAFLAGVGSFCKRHDIMLSRNAIGEKRARSYFRLCSCYRWQHAD